VCKKNKKLTRRRHRFQGRKHQRPRSSRAANGSGQSANPAEPENAQRASQTQTLASY